LRFSGLLRAYGAACTEEKVVRSMGVDAVTV
jgi:hypothetical protein